jgi:FkbM family methyltransferase
MPNIFNYLKRPEYVFRPKQVLRRFRRFGKPAPAELVVALPWGAGVRVRTSENVGSDIYHYGIFDKIVPEAIWRLLDAGETGVDIGANIGQNSSAMAFKSGPGGRVISFEPHPTTFPELRKNADSWPKAKCAQVELNNVALGQQDGEAILAATEYLSGASLRKEGAGVKVPVRRLDDFLRNVTVGVCKIDVEGHELSVLEGAPETLKRRAIRDLVFEDFNPQPSDVSKLLRANGFHIFELHERWLKPVLQELSGTGVVEPGFSYNFLATQDPKRASGRFRSAGWHCLTC